MAGTWCYHGYIVKLSLFSLHQGYNVSSLFWTSCLVCTLTNADMITAADLPSSILPGILHHFNQNSSKSNIGVVFLVWLDVLDRLHVVVSQCERCTASMEGPGSSVRGQLPAAQTRQSCDTLFWGRPCWSFLNTFKAKTILFSVCSWRL